MKRPPGITPPPPEPVAPDDPPARGAKPPRARRAAPTRPAPPGPASDAETAPIDVIPRVVTRDLPANRATAESGQTQVDGGVRPRTGTRSGRAWWRDPRPDAPSDRVGETVSSTRAGSQTAAGDAGAGAAADADADSTVPIGPIRRPGASAGATPRSPQRSPQRSTGRNAAGDPREPAGARGATPSAPSVPSVPRSTTAGAEKARRAAASVGIAEAPPPGRAGAGARRELRQAVRTRRRYEKAESRRFTQRSRRRRLALAIVGASVAALVVVVLLVAYSPVLAVRSIVVEGASRLDAAAVSTALADEQGKPLALIDYDSIERELEQFPLIATYSVEARPPDTLAIRLVERRPVAQVQTAAGYELIDAAGVTVQQSGERIAGFPLLDLSGTAIGSAGFEAAAAVLTSLPDALLGQVDAISGTTPDSVTLSFTGAGQRVVWGSAEDSALKARILQQLIATQDPAAAVEYDVSSPQSPVVR